MRKITAPLIVFSILTAVYLWTMTPDLFWIDSAAFAACNEILGLPHSPGFPLYTVIGRMVHSILPVSPATASNLYSVLATAMAGMVFYRILYLLLTSPKSSSRNINLAAVTGTLFAFLTVPIWQSAVRAEVYAVQLLLSLLIIRMFIGVARSELISRKIRYALVGIFLQGLSFTNHSLLGMISAPLIPAMLFFIPWMALRKGILKYASAAAILFSVALSLYLFLPIRANCDPAINSGQPKTLSATLASITRSGEDYLPAGPQQKVDYAARAGNLAVFVFEQTGAVILLAIGFGIFLVWRRRLLPMIFLALLIPIGFGITIWAADFRPMNFDIAAYSGLPLIILVAFSFFGLHLIVERIGSRRPFGRLAPAVFLLAVFLQFSGNLFACDLSGTNGPDRLADAILNKAPARAVLIVNEDNVILPLWYHRFALNERPDLALISAGALYRPSYRNEIRQLYPHLDYPPGFDSHKIDDLAAVIQDFCDANASSHPIQIQFGVPGIDARKISPDGFLFRYGNEAATVDHLYSKYLMSMLDSLADGASDLLTTDFLARTAFNYGVYFDEIGRIDFAFELFEYAIETDNENPEYLLRLAIAFINSGDHAKASMLLEEATRTGDGCPEAETILARLSRQDLVKDDKQ